jgi:GNAT superfamily N-acetyltransferase
MNYRVYDPVRDKAAVHRIFREVGWHREGKEEMIDLFLEAGRTLVVDIHGEPECVVGTSPGVIRYLREDLPLCAVTSVCTSRIARRQGLGKRLTAEAVAAFALDGALVAALGVFDQGYYDQIGFGTTSYEHVIAFDPQHLNVRVRPRVPRRLTLDDWEAIHASRLVRVRGHGSLNILSPTLTRAEMLEAPNGFGLGYCDGPGGELTHSIWFRAPDVEYGPYEIKWLVYQTPSQFLELMALIQSLGDQVRLVTMHEPQGIQLQDLLDRPLRRRDMTRGSPYENAVYAFGEFQMRICDLPGCMERARLPWGEVRFNLSLTDPVERLLDAKAPWRGVAGEYMVTLGPSSGAERGRNPALPTLTATVNAFTRMWLGVRPATGLAVTDDLAGPPELLERLDWVLRMPEPKPDFEF